MAEVQTRNVSEHAEEHATSPTAVPERISTNNPFRRGTGSPAPSPGLPSGSPSRRPVSRNPFLDQAASMEAEKTQQVSASPPRPTRTRPKRSPTETQGLLANMSLDEVAGADDDTSPVRNGHHTSRSNEDRPRRPNGGPGPPGRRMPPRGPPYPRRNSDTSINERRPTEDGPRPRGTRPTPGHGPRPGKDSQGRPIPSKGPRDKRTNRRLDVIDKLDLTSIYGSSHFHHDGPFDACNPHRNRKGSSRAPMSAFAADSLNNAIGGSGPLKKDIDLDRIHGRQEDSFNDFSAPAVAAAAPPPVANSGQFEPYISGTYPRKSQIRDGVDRTSRFDATSKVDRVHGDESLGLGTTTFLEGAPAPRTAIERRESEGEGTGLTRKKSLAQRIRGMGSVSRPRGNSNSNNSSGLASPDPRYERTSPLETASAGGLTRIHEQNPFFQDHDAAYVQKGASIQQQEEQRRSGGEKPTITPVADADQEAFTVRSPTSPVTSPNAAPYELKRAVTEGATASSTAPAFSEERNSGSSNGGGFLNRVKSLRGGKQNKPRLDK